MSNDFLSYSLVFFTGAGTLLLYIKFFGKKTSFGTRPPFMSVESKKSFEYFEKDLDAKQSKQICEMEIKVINTMLEPMKDDIEEIKDDMKKVLKGINGKGM